MYRQIIMIEKTNWYDKIGKLICSMLIWSHNVDNLWQVNLLDNYAIIIVLQEI
jgi:hypothetical protein